MRGKFYIVGVGPGAPDLLTVRAIRVLERIPVLFVPKGRSEGSSVALAIIENAVSLKNKEVIELYFPMDKIRRVSETSETVQTAWQQAAAAVLNKLDAGIDSAFPTLGDPSFYSTAQYLLMVLARKIPDLRAEIVPGVSAISAAACSGRVPVALGDERIAVLPATYEEEGIREALLSYDTVVFMKIHKALDRILTTLQELTLLDRAFIVEKASMEDERVIPASQARDIGLHYFSTMIVRKN